MTSAAESFVLELARSTSRRTHRLLRGLSKWDRDDVLSAAILTCWEEKDSYDYVQTLEDWFMQALVKARNDHRKNYRHSHEPLGDELGVPDDVIVRSSQASTAELLLRHFNADERKGLQIIENGDTRRVAKRLKWSPHQERAFRAKIRSLRQLIPDLPHLELYVPPARTLMHKASDGHLTELSKGDRELARIDFVPEEGKDCPPCWLCKYFEGWSPARYKPTRLVDPEVQRAAQDTETRKILIANEVSNRGDL